MSDEARAQSAPGPAEPSFPRYATFTSRARALLIDSAVGFAALIALVLLSDATGDVPGFGRIIWLGLVGWAFLYEPVLVWRRGATIGHAFSHLQVTDVRTGDPPRLARAFARYFVKMVLGVPSFITMALTRKHQAVHDVLTQTVVELSATADLTTQDYHVERVEPSDIRLPPRWQRAIVIAVYLAAIFIAYGIGLVAVDRDGCASTQSCSVGTRITIEVLGLGWLALSVASIIAGWKGLLLGARRTRAISIESPVA